MHDYVPVREAVRLTGLASRTLQIWADEDKIKTYRTMGNQRMFCRQGLQELIDHRPTAMEKKNYLYCRVSSAKQKDDLVRQVEEMRSLYPNHMVIQDVGSGINFKRKGLRAILELAMQGKIREVVIAHKDRLATFAYDLLEWILTKNGGSLVCLDKTKKFHSDAQELAEDLLRITHVFSCRINGKRRYKKCSDSSLPYSPTSENTEAVDGCRQESMESVCG